MTKVLVVGGGPGGSVAATLLAQQGVEVRLVERERFPRYHIGESLTPATRSVLELAGAARAIDESGFQVKRGGVWLWGTDYWRINWTELFGGDVHTWQVDREHFDKILLDHARTNGVEVSEGVAARSVHFDGTGRPTAVECRPEGGDPYSIEDFDFLLDASGRYGLLSVRHLRNRQPHPIFRNVAIWGYWKGGRVLPGAPEGAVNVISTPHGWWWVIPLAGDRTSVGLVLHKDEFARRRREHGSLEDLYQVFIDESEEVRDLVAGAEYMAPARVETDYSYTAERFSGPGYMLIGDAACFLDPLLATGMHLALLAALLSAACIASVARDEVSEDQAVDFFELSYRRAYARLLALVSAMYERYEGPKELFWTAARLATDTPDEHVDTSFAEIIAGLTDLREIARGSERVLTRSLIAEARKVQAAAMDSPDGTHPNLQPLEALPTEISHSGLRLVTSPRLGLARTEETSP